jgi:hypothetical protein
MSLSSVSYPDATHLSLTLYINFISHTFTGQKYVYEVVTDHAGQINANGPTTYGWLQVGTWNIGVPITITTAPAGLSLTVDTATSCNPAPCTYWWYPGDTSHTISAAAQGNATTQYVNPSWSDNGAASHSITVPSSATTYTASFSTIYYLTTAVSPPGSGSIYPPSGWYYSGTAVTLTESPASGYAFAGFTNTGGTLSGSTITMSGPATVTANFLILVTVTSVPPGLSLTVGNLGCITPCNYQWTPGSPSHTITVNNTTQTQPGVTGTQYVFANWSGLGNAPSQTVAPTAPATYTANFTTQYYLTTSVSPAGPSVPLAGGITAARWFR